MTNLIEKISSYNLFNYLLPGILFAAVGDYITVYTFIHDDLLIGLFLYYFIGLVLSRIGSLVIGPLMQKVKFVDFAPYRDFVKATSRDEKIELLSEQNNMYRTLCALFLALGALKGFEMFDQLFSMSPESSMYVLIVLLFLLFALSYRKQTGFIKKRIEAANEVADHAPDRKN